MNSLACVKTSVAQTNDDFYPSPVEFVAQNEMKERLAQALNTLHPLERKIIVLHDSKGLSFGAIAKELDYSRGHVAHLHSRAIIRLNRPGVRNFLSGERPVMEIKGEPLLPYEKRVSQMEAESKRFFTMKAKAKLARLKKQASEIQAKIAEIESELSS
jgi:hypothetical protein